MAGLDTFVNRILLYSTLIFNTKRLFNVVKFEVSFCVNLKIRYSFDYYVGWTAICCKCIVEAVETALMGVIEFVGHAERL